MVEDRITDGKRIAQLLASELTGPVATVSVVDATPDVEPTPDGTEAYGVAVDDERVGTVTVFPEYAVLSVRGTRPETTDAASGVTVESNDGEIHIQIDHGAAVKRAVDRLVETVSE